MQHLTLMLDSSLLHQPMIITYQSTSLQLQSYGPPLHLLHLHHHLYTPQHHNIHKNHCFILSPVRLLPNICRPATTNRCYPGSQRMHVGARLRCLPVVELARDPMVENLIHSLQDHLPPCVEDQDIIIINTPPEYIEETSDSDVVCLD